MNVNVPAAVGAPLSVPLLDSVRPAGRLPATIVKLLYGALPPLPVIVWLYGSPSRSLGSEPGARVIVGGATVRL